MPKHVDIQSILVVGAGPIVIGQACEFDYSGAQACKALREEGCRVVLVNSNPATIMTDPEMADVTYIEPIQWQVVQKIIEKEQVDAILPTMGGQTALNCALELARRGILQRHNVTMIGASVEAIAKAEDRRLFGQAMKAIGLETPRSGVASSMKEAFLIAERVGFPTIIRPSFTMGGSGGGIAYNREEFEEICLQGLALSPTSELLIDESIIGWKEFELEVVRDRVGNCIIICSIENFDPMGVHTGDSITVAPAQTLTDKEYQIMRNAAIAVMQEIGIDGGGANVQFAVNPEQGRLVVVEMNPRVSRSSALASKATGFPIAKVAAKLAIGYTLDELKNDISGGKMSAAFEPTIDYVVTKIPRFNFEKFPGANDRLTTQMKSVGEVMAIGRSFQESLQKALRGLEVGASGLESRVDLTDENSLSLIRYQLKEPGAERVWYIADAFRAGLSLDGIHHLTNIDRWFLAHIEFLVQLEQQVAAGGFICLRGTFLRHLKRQGFADLRLAELVGVSEEEVRKRRWSEKIFPVYKRVDTCSAEFDVDTRYLYSSYEEECEANPSDRRKIMILGGGPNRIGQGIEFDYCCVHASMALREDGFETIMVNCNPETVSTDYDASDRLYFESITLEDILEIVRVEQPDGVIVQYGGQTPLKLARKLQEAGVPIIGTAPDSIDCAEDRRRFQQVVQQLGLLQPSNATVSTRSQAHERADEIGYPLVVRPSYVLGGRSMEVVYDQKDLLRYFDLAVSVSNDAPVLLDRFLDNATEIDVDAICDGEQVLIGGIVEHIEQAGVHSGDSACSLPTWTLSSEIQERVREQVKQLAFALGVKGLMNVQFAIQDGKIYLIEANLRASRTVPFVSKVTGVPLAKIAARVMAGRFLAEQPEAQEVIPPYYAVKNVVFSSTKFSGVDPILGPEMRSTGEVMGIGRTFAEAFAKGLVGANQQLPKIGRALLSVHRDDKKRVVKLAAQLLELGFELDATHGTAGALGEAGINSRLVNKVHEGRPHIQDRAKNGEYTYIVNTAKGSKAIEDSKLIRGSALQYNVHYDTTLNGAFTTALALTSDPFEQVVSLQDWHLQIEG